MTYQNNNYIYIAELLFMKSNHTFIILIVAFMALLGLSNCNNNRQCDDLVTQVETFEFTADELSKVPYTGTDTLYFLSNQGDTCIVQGIGKKCTYNTEVEPNGIGCEQPQNIKNYQTCVINFIPIKGDLEFNLTTSKKERRIIVEWLTYRRNFYFPFSNTGVPIENKDFYIDTLTINNVKYEVIRKDFGFAPFAVNPDTLTKLLYNKSNGLLLLENKLTNQQYSIIPKP